MGNYTYLDCQEGCEIDKKKLEKLMKSRKIEYYDDKEFLEKLHKNAWTLGDELNGCKIQGYWYPNTVKFLYACADAMKGLTDCKCDNQIEMTEEQGYKIWINFFLEGKKRVVDVDYVPMDMRTMTLFRDGEHGD